MHDISTSGEVLAMLFTDIEGSTHLARALGSDWPPVLGEHRRLLVSAIVGAGGSVRGTEGDALFATFERVEDAVVAAAVGQRSLRSCAWPSEVGEIRVRMGVHTGAVHRDPGGLVGIEIHRAARIGAAAHGGQVLLSVDARAGLSADADVEDLGLHRLKDFPEPLRLFHLRVHSDRGASAFPAPRTLRARPTNLPPERRALVGRDAVSAEVGEALRNHRLVTLTGLGGVGKTHLALSVAAAMLSDQPGGVWLVRGDRLRAANELIPSLAAAMRVRDVPGRGLVDTIAEHLQDDAAMVVLDNLEHLPGAAIEISHLVSGVPSVRVLATSRAPLRLALERRIPVEPLASEDAAALFIALAREADSGTPVDDRVAVEAICRALEGLPLALELATARLRVLSLSQLAERLASMADWRSQAPDLPDRQRSLRATVDWSLALLSRSAQQLFSHMGVFAGPVALEVIEAVADKDLEVLESAAELLDYALLRRSERGLELVAALREIAREALITSGHEQRIRRLHADVVIATAECAGPIFAADRADRGRMEALLAEAWHAVSWARAADPQRHIRLATLYGPAWGFVEGRVREAMTETSRALAAGELVAGTNELADLLFVQSTMLSWCGREQDGLRLAERAAAMIEDRPAAQAADNLITLSIVRDAAGSHEGALAAAREAVVRAREIGHGGRLLRNLAYQAQALVNAGDLDVAGPVLDEAEVLAGVTDTVMADVLPSLRADWALAQGNVRAALTGYAASLTATIRRGELGAVVWDAAGIVVALAELHDPAAVIEVGTLLELAAADQGVDLRSLRSTGVTVPEAIAVALADLPLKTAEAIRLIAKALPTNQRPDQILKLANARVTASA
jgi:predicted ATPase/class 3 adenylate cyclase